MGAIFRRGKAYPLGVTRQRKGINFAVFANEVTELKLEILKSGNSQTYILSPERNRTGFVWHCELQGLEPPFDYLYYALNPALDESEEIPLLDPYAKALSGLEEWGMPKVTLAACYQEPDFDWEEDYPPAHTSSQSIIYELHVRGFTKDPSSEVDFPGTYEGIVEKIPYLKSLGITAVELMPIHEFDEVDNPFHDPDTGEDLKNFWGYSNLNFFAPKGAYAADPKKTKGVNAFKYLVKKLHQADIEVILDVVFNHTAEGGAQGRVYNFKALSRDVYYLFDEEGEYANYSGCGNTLNCNHPVTRKMILDALVYWVVEMHIDGFRFDLASILSRDELGEVLTNPPLLEAIAKHQVLSGSKIIAEAWDAQGLYQVGAFPASHRRWAEWNGRFRDVMRHFVRGDRGVASEIATRMAGSEDLYGHSERNPFHSINFITSHDGFTLKDLVSFEEKHNEANGEENRDGSNDNLSKNYGQEGLDVPEEILQFRAKQIRNLACLLLLSQGTPMILAGDEWGNSQGGNNNTWCQDSPTGWLNWPKSLEGIEQFEFWKALIAFRKSMPQFAKKEFYTGEPDEASGLPDLSWHGAEAWKPKFKEDFCHLAFLIDGMRHHRVVSSCLYVALNFEKEMVEFELPEVRSSKPWIKILDSNDPADFIDSKETELPHDMRQIPLAPFSIWVLKRSYDPGA